MSSEQIISNVLIIDDMPIFCRGLRDILDDTDDFNVLGATGDEQTGLGLATLQPDITLVHLEARTFDALHLIDEIKTRAPRCRIIVTMHSEASASLLMRAIQHEANGYLLRTISIDEFLSELRAAAQGGMAASEKLTSALAEQLRNTTSTTVNDQNVSQLLTRREYQVMRCIATGLLNHEIATKLGISEGTVKVHVKHLLKKLKVRSRIEAAVWGAERGHGLTEEELASGTMRC